VIWFYHNMFFFSFILAYLFVFVLAFFIAKSRKWRLGEVTASFTLVFCRCLFPLKSESLEISQSVFFISPNGMIHLWPNAIDDAQCLYFSLHFLYFLLFFFYSTAQNAYRCSRTSGNYLVITPLVKWQCQIRHFARLLH